MTVTTPSRRELRFLWLELTGKCPLNCVHCYASSSPEGTHGTMQFADWMRVIDEASQLGVPMIQFTGGEPTSHPDFAALVQHALALGIEVEVFSNLVHVTPELWDLFGHEHVRLATSYYSDDTSQHTAITGSSNSHALTTGNIAEAVRRGIAIRIGIVDILDGQRTDEAETILRSLGVTQIGRDRLRGVGRGGNTEPHTPDQLCGNCANGVMVISPDGTARPCVFSRWMSVGSVLVTSLADIVSGARMQSARTTLTGHFDRQRRATALATSGEPGAASCNPGCGPNCSPVIPHHPGNATMTEKAQAPTASCNPGCGPNCSPVIPYHLDQASMATAVSSAV